MLAQRSHFKALLHGSGGKRGGSTATWTPAGRWENTDAMVKALANASWILLSSPARSSRCKQQDSTGCSMCSTCMMKVHGECDGNTAKGTLSSVQGSPEVFIVQEMLKERSYQTEKGRHSLPDRGTAKSPGSRVRIKERREKGKKEDKGCEGNL